VSGGVLGMPKRIYLQWLYHLKMGRWC
jgi:hypothetical protein